MSASNRNATTVLRDYYRSPDEFDVFKPVGHHSSSPGFFTFGTDTVCYGRTSGGHSPEASAKILPDALRSVDIANHEAVLPFDPQEIIENLRWERYMASCDGWLLRMIQKPYYALRPLMPVWMRQHLQRVYLKQWRQISFPQWPVDRTVENIFEQLVRLSLAARSERQMPFVWFWPEGYSACLILTHDIETVAGRDYSTTLADIDASFGMKSSFQVVPEQRYEVSEDFLDSLRGRKAEINLHGLNHDGQLFRDRRQFLKEAVQINRYLKKYSAAGFRSPVMYRNLNWYADLDFSYDMSVPNVAHLDPQRGGCCTVMPYFVGDKLELPLTTTQDYSLFTILGERSIDLWKQQIHLILEKNGLVSLNIHPDYIACEPYQGVYRELLEHLRRLCAERNVWIAQPGEVDKWWRARRAMQVAVDGQDAPGVIGESAERAAVAYARIEGGRIVYDVSKSKPVSTVTPASTQSVACYEATL